MFQPVISGTGVFTPDQVISNAELVEAFNAYVDKQNAANAAAIEAGEAEPLSYSSESFIVAASGIEQRFVMDKAGVLDPDRMC
ncbi:MAG: beta-ketoacyl-ACP synthase III, partial [Rhodobacterales bacterium]